MNKIEPHYRAMIFVEFDNDFSSPKDQRRMKSR